MIIGVGIDMIDSRRIATTLERHQGRFISRVFTPLEIQRCESRARKALQFAKIYAAKEAFLKAIGTGLAKGVQWKNIEISHYPSGQPYITVSGKALRILTALTPAGSSARIHLSISDEDPYAIAYVTINTEREQEDVVEKRSN